MELAAAAKEWTQNSITMKKQPKKMEMNLNRLNALESGFKQKN